MGTPADHLPPPISTDSINSLVESIGKPEPVAVTSVKVTAQFHSIYFTEPTDGDHDEKELVLCISGPHIPRIEIINEVVIMRWISQNTTIPVPQVLSYDPSINNAIQHEYILLSLAPGHPLSEIYQLLDDIQISEIIDQLIDVLVQLHAVDWNAIGGLTFDDKGDIVIGPVLEETFWHVPEIQSFWPPGETMGTLNIQGPYPTYVDYNSAHVQRYIHAIQTHEKLAFMQDIVPRLEAFLNALADHATELNKVKLKLVHKDLHFANILFDRESSRITAILDWEFAGVVPFTKWNPSRAFLWNGQDRPDSLDEKVRLLKIFEERCKERNITILEDAEIASPLQKAMQTAIDFLRAIVKVAPRDQEAARYGWNEGSDTPDGHCFCSNPT
jgi:Phosphotransferase enzyme family